MSIEERNKKLNDRDFLSFYQTLKEIVTISHSFEGQPAVAPVLIWKIEDLLRCICRIDARQGLMSRAQQEAESNDE